MEELKDHYLRNCRLSRVVDGATILLTLTLGFHVVIQHSIRLFGIAAPKGLDEKEQTARKFVMDWFRDHRHGLGYEERFPFICRSYKADNLGRFLGHVYCTEGHALNDELIASGLVESFERK